MPTGPLGKIMSNIGSAPRSRALGEARDFHTGRNAHASSVIQHAMEGLPIFADTQNVSLEERLQEYQALGNLFGGVFKDQMKIFIEKAKEGNFTDPFQGTSMIQATPIMAALLNVNELQPISLNVYRNDDDLEIRMWAVTPIVDTLVKQDLFNHLFQRQTPYQISYRDYPHNNVAIFTIKDFFKF